jgi:ribosomal protein S7
VFDQLKAVQGDVDDLNAMLLAHNLKSAMGLYEARIKQLRERALAIKDLFAKIKKAGTDMDGNHTEDEIDFVEALAEEMPTVDEEMGACLDKIDECERIF